MSYVAKIILDSLAPGGARLTTFELTYPRFVHSEFMTHRVFSRNAASSRAIPIAKIIEMVQKEPAMPVYWGKNQAGMQAAEELHYVDQRTAKKRWLKARDSAVYHAKHMIDLNVHKQIVNRLLEPWAWITVVCTATEYPNFFGLRCDSAAQPEIRRAAILALGAYMNSTPRELKQGEWHLPYVLDDERDLPIADQLCISVARCGRVSYVRQGELRDLQEDVAWHDRGRDARHWSPFEHQAQAGGSHMWNTWNGNFYGGWKQYRQMFADQSGKKTDLNVLWDACREEVEELLRAA
jgi:thymidylate synthase ThyX